MDPTLPLRPHPAVAPRAGLPPSSPPLPSTGSSDVGGLPDGLPGRLPDGQPQPPPGAPAAFRPPSPEESLPQRAGGSFVRLTERPVDIAHARNAGAIAMWRQGLADAQKIPKVTTDCITHACQDWEDVVACLRAAWRCTGWAANCAQPQGESPYLSLYRSALTRCQASGWAREALLLFDHLLLHGARQRVPARPDVTCYGYALWACTVLGHADQALAVLEHLLEHGPALPVPLFADPRHCATTMAVVTSQHRPDLALRLLARLERLPDGRPERAGLTRSLYNAAMQVCRVTSRIDLALALFDQMRRHGPSLPQPVHPDQQTYNNLLACCVESGRTDRYADLLRCGIQGLPGRPDSRVFRKSLGWQPGRGVLDLHSRNVLRQGIASPSGHDPGIFPPLARAIFHCLWGEPQQVLAPGAAGIDRHTIVIVGWRGTGQLRDTIRQCIRERGFEPVHPLDERGSPDAGRLAFGAPRPAPVPPGLSTLNPLASEFRPRT